MHGCATNNCEDPPERKEYVTKQKGTSTNPEGQERFVPIPESAEILGISIAKTYLLGYTGQLHIRKIGRRSGVLYSDLVKFLINLPVKQGKSQIHRERALDRWAAREGAR